MSYPVDLALDQWNEGHRRVAGDPALALAVDAVLDEVRRRLGSAFEISELTELYGAGTDWALEVAQRYGAGGDSSWVVDAAFARYARQASDFAGGRLRRLTDVD